MTIGTESKCGNKMERTYTEVAAENTRMRVTIEGNKRTRKQVDGKKRAFQVNGKKLNGLKIHGFYFI